MNTRHRTWSAAVGVSAVVALGFGLAAAPSATAGPTDIISSGSGQIIDGSVLAMPNFAGLASNGAATAQQIGTPPSGPAVIESSTPLDLSAAFGIVNVGAGNIPLLGNNGIIQLGAVSQYGKAVNDGSSAAFSGTVSGAPGLVTLPGGLPTSGSPSIPAAEIKVGTANILGGADLVNLDLKITTLAAAAKQDQGAAPAGAYSVAGVSADLGGTVIGGVAGTVGTAINTANLVLGPLGVTVANPVAGGTISITEADLLAVAGVPSLNALPPGTDLVSFLPQAVAAKITSLVNSTLASATAAVNALGPIAQITAGSALAVLTTALNGVVSGVSSTIVTPLSNALTALVSAKVNVQQSSGGIFTERALQVGIAGGSIATVNLANASVGPNLLAAAIPVVNNDTLAISGAAALLALVCWFLFRARRRTAVPAA
ncbi:choice-of-anchor G family protein [Arthrobacter sp. efr-133-R2A-120]|uniref:PVV-CTERM domain-containing choice-of-anchor G protein n=1 Tax=Arthrobacter sp. efr-133-R2A-120 TaxID=3040277 RepID=UPI0025508909|nr:choice-of-anchor G family protein [Arthrobacter sp. efr-133-R2A-120]